MARSCTWKNCIDDIQSMIDEEYSLDAIGAHYGVSRQRIYQVMTKYGIETPLRSRKNFLRDKPAKYTWWNKMLCQKGVGKDARRRMLYEIEPPDNCPVFGFPLNYDGCKESTQGWIARDDHSPSIDQIEAGKGYTEDNIQIISWRANRIKNDATASELRILADYMEKLSIDKKLC